MSSLSQSMSTLKNVHAIVDGKIWDFPAMKFTRFDPVNDRERCQILISQYAKKLFKVAYLTTHTCRQEDIECSLPMENVLEVFSPEEWIQKLKAIKKELHRDVLTGKLVDEIMARWQLYEDYPKRQPGEAESREKIEARMKTWERFTDKDPEMTRWLVAPLAESIDYDEILRAETPDMATLREWTRSCLVAAAEKAFSLQRDVRGLELGKRGGGHQSAFALNREWEDLPNQEPWKSRLLGVLVPINSDFGGGKRTSMTIIPTTLDDDDSVAPYTPRKTSGGGKSRSKPSEKIQKTEDELKKESERRKLRRTGGVTASNIFFPINTRI
ncbi:hypothetical protein VE02_02302 [Pseudogymnoascus sp. 03VT05]|nr:hypothetical protein VE02_02302 [Pseudogymnoascus sp. 03VT05]